MADFDPNKSWLQNKDTSNISIKFNKHLKHGRHRTKYNFIDDPTDTIDPNVQEYNGIDFKKALLDYIEELNLGNIEFSVFQCKSKSKIPAYYANIKLGNTSLASSFPEKYSVPDVAKQVAARNALGILKKRCSKYKDIPTTRDMTVVAKRLEKELQKNYGLFCDKVEDVYKEVYNEQLPTNWLAQLGQLTTNILIEDLPKLNKSILYYSTRAAREKHTKLIDAEIIGGNLPLMKFVDKTKKSVCVTSIDSNHMVWIRFVHDKINDDFYTLSKLMDMPDESKHYIRMADIELFDVYAVHVDNNWFRYQVINVNDDNVTGILIDLGVEWCVSKINVMLLPPKFLNVPSQAIKCALTNLFFAPYFEISKQLFIDYLIKTNCEFMVAPDNIDGDIPMVTLFDGINNMNDQILNNIIIKTNFNQIDSKCHKANLAYIANGYVYLHPSNETLLVLESVLDSICASRPLDQLYSKKSISPHKIYLVKCTEIGIWSRAKIDNFTFDDEKFKVYFIDYGNYGFIERDKFIDLQQIDTLLATIGPQALKVEFHLFPPEKLNDKLSKALYEMTLNKLLDVKIVSTNNDGVQIVEMFDINDLTGNYLSFNTQLYQSI